MQTPRSALKIKVKGSLHLGRSLDLVQRVEKTFRTKSFFDTGHPADGLLSRAMYAQPTNPAGVLPMERLEHVLQDKNDNLFIDNDGLCASYGIFGAPGSGKTYFLLY